MKKYVYRRMNRELRKIKYRALGSGALILVAIAAYVGLASMVPSASDTLELKVEELQLSDYIVYVNGANDSDRVELLGIAGVEEVDYRLLISSRVQLDGGGSDPTTFSAILVGIDPSRMPYVNNFDLGEGDGAYFGADWNGSVLLEKGFAGMQGVEPGESVSLLTPYGFVGTNVTGLVFTPEHIFMPVNPQSVIPMPGTLAVVYIPIDWMRTTYGFPDGFVNEFTFLFTPGADDESVTAGIDQQLSSRTIIYSTPQDQIYGYSLIKEDLRQGDSFAGVFAFIILLVAFFVVYSSFSRIIQEQKREIGVLRALGYSRGSVLGSYMYMAALIGLTSTLLGLLLAIPIGQWFADYYVESTMFTEVSQFKLPLTPVFIGLLFGPLTACLACGVAVWGTVSMEPQLAIRGAHYRKRPIRSDRKKPWKRRLGSPGSYILLYTMRNIARHKARTALTVIAVACCILVGSIALLMMASFSNSIESSVQQNEHWDMIVEYAYPLSESEAAEVTLPDIQNSVNIARISGSWQGPEEEGKALIIALTGDQQLHDFSISQGEIAESDDQAMVGYTFAEDYGFLPGDGITIESQNGSISLTVSGVVEDMIGEIFVDMKTMQNIMGELFFIGTYLTCTDGSEETVRTQLLQMPLVADVQLKEGLQSGLIDLMASYDQLLYMFSLVGVAISTITIANIVYVGVLERYPEYGQLRAIGYSKRAISTSIYSEIVIVISIGAVIGVPIMLIALESMVEMFKSFWPVYETILYLGDWIDYVYVLVLTFAFGLLAAIPGIRYVNKMELAKIVSGGRFG